MKLNKKIGNVLEIVWALAWLLSSAAMDITVSVVNGMRTTLGEDGRPVSIAAFVAVMAASVFLIGITGTLIAVLKVN